eukprot:TRINITY_DN2916_c0_g3_i1.p1 TRINITY_DN2916_c0_g3~~TRINITY_DN2916_c0_g3_i1.p1  ORF type:complete len:185 (-),score=47.93 TRINITY_DN2916_c0_g3_i1:234-788(-)
MARKASLLSAAVLVFLASSLLVSFAPKLYVPRGRDTGRRQALQAIAAAAAATSGTEAAKADAYGSKPWALSKYAPRVLSLKDDVERGNLKPVLEREGSFKGLNGYWMFSPELYAKKGILVDNLLAAVENSDTATAKKLYAEYINDDVLKQWASIKPRNQGRIMNVASALMTGQSTYASGEGRGI